MLRAMLFPIVALLSVIFLKKKYYFHHMVSLVSIVMGVSIVGLVSVQNHNDGGKSSTTFLGAALIVGS